MKVSCQERKFLAACLNGRREEVNHFDTGPDGNWEGLIRAAAGEFLLPSLHYQLAMIGMTPPSEISEFLESVETANGERNEQILDEVRAIAERLNGIGVEPVLL